MLLLLIQFIGLFGFGLMLMEACRLRLDFFLEAPIAFVLGLLAHFALTNAIAYLFHINGFQYASWIFSIVGVLFLAWKFFGSGKRSSTHADAYPSFDKTVGLKVLFGAFTLFALEYLVVCWQQIQVARHISGIVYQDIVYLIGVGRTILQTNQFPIPDIQIAGSELRYHTLAYHFTAFFLDSISQNEFFIYVLLVKLGSILFTIWSFTALSLVVWGKRLSWIQYVLLILATLNVEFLLSGTNVTLFETYFSLSFCLQLALLALLTMYVKVVFLERSMYTVGTVVLFLLLFASAILIKASSLIVLPIWGLLFLFLKVNPYHRVELFKLGIALTGVAAFVYVVFFLKESGRSNLLLGIQDWNCTLCDVPLTGRYAGWSSWLDSTQWDEILIGVLSFLSVRFVLLYKEPHKWVFVSLIALAGIFSLVIKQDAFAFYLPIVVLLSLFSIGKLLLLQPGWIKYVGLIVLILSLHPVNSVGNYIGRKLGYKLEKSIPIDQNQYDFLKDMARYVEPDGVVYTFNHYSDSLKTSDYFYPAALSGRQFFLGGTRFAVNGDISDDSLQHRIDLVQSIELGDSAQWLKRIAETGSGYIYIHKDRNTMSAFESLKAVVPKGHMLMSDSSNLLIKIH